MDIFDSVVLACKALDDMKTTNIVVCDVSKLASISKYFIIATSTSNVQGRAAANAVCKLLEESGVDVLCKEGGEQSDWVCIDCYDFVVHIMTSDAREYYNIDKLLGDGKNTKKFETILKEIDHKAKKAERKSNKEQKSAQKSAAKKESKEKKTSTKIAKKQEKPQKSEREMSVRLLKAKKSSKDIQVEKTKKTTK